MSEHLGKGIKKALRDSQERYRRITKAITDYIYTVSVVDGEPEETVHSEACFAVTGYSRQEFSEDPYLWIRMVIEEDRGIVQKQINQVLSGDFPQPVEHRIIKKDGTIRWVESTIVPSYDESGTLISYDGIVKDITDRKLAEARVARKNKIFKAINKVFQEALTCKTEEELGKMCLSVAEELSGSKFGFIGELNENGLFDTIAISNPGWDECRMAVLDARTYIKSMPVRGVDRATMLDGISRIVNGENAIAAHPDHVGTPNGHPKLTAFLGVPLKHEGKTIGMIGLGNKDGGYTIEDQENIEDLSVAIIEALRSKRAEKRLRDSEERFRLLVDGVCDYAIFMLDAKGYVASWNETAKRINGYDDKEIIGKHFSCFYQAHDIEAGKPEQQLEAAVSAGRSEYEGWHVRKDGSTFLTNTLITALRDDEGILYGFAVITRDITERKSLEKQLLHSQRMEAVGQLAGCVAHDFNNILAAIINYGYLANKNMIESDPAREYIDKILSLSDKATQITQGLLAFSRKQHCEFEPVRLNNVVRTVARLLTGFIGEDISILTKLTDKEPVILADKTQVEQIIINLATNARDAMPDGGEFKIETDIVEIDESFKVTHRYGEIGTYALLTVSDTGTGMSDETKRKIFEPFFTTKETGKGTGLGLAIIYRIVKEHNGYINVYSEPGSGTAFRIYLPVDRPDVSIRKVTTVEYPELTGHGEMLLLAEDEHAVRLSEKKILEESGYRVVEAADGEDAIAKFNEHQDEISLLILDAVMPRKNAIETLAAVRKINSEIKAIFTSGYTAEILKKMKIYEPGVPLISKPVLPSNFLLRIKSTLEG
jgi:PAS domain S-box-containing protein